MDFFKPNGSKGDGKNQKMTGANIHKNTEDRLKNMKEKRQDRREKLNRQISNDNDNSYFKETEKLRKNKDLSRSEYHKQERKDISRLGLKKNKNDEK